MRKIGLLFLLSISFVVGCSRDLPVGLSENHKEVLSDAAAFVGFVRGERPPSSISEILARKAQESAAQKARNDAFDKTGNIATLEQLKKAAEDGDPAAQLHLARGFFIGPNPVHPVEFKASVAGLPQDFDKAKYWCVKAAEQGNANAAHFLQANHEKLGLDFGRRLFWLAKLAASASSDSLDLASFGHTHLRVWEQTSEQNIANMEIWSLRFRLLSEDQQKATSALSSLDYLRRGRSSANTRQLTDDEIRIVRSLGFECVVEESPEKARERFNKVSAEKLARELASARVAAEKRVVGQLNQWATTKVEIIESSAEWQSREGKMEALSRGGGPEMWAEVIVVMHFRYYSWRTDYARVGCRRTEVAGEWLTDLLSTTWKPSYLRE